MHQKWNTDYGIYVIADTTYLNPKQMLARLSKILSTGVDAVQFRHKKEDQAKLSEIIALRELCNDYGTPLIINDDVQLARDAGAQGVHLGRDDPSLAFARTILGNESIVGVTGYQDPGNALKAHQDGADYVAFGRFFPSGTKPFAPRAKLNVLDRARRGTQLPIVAIGGINTENAARLIMAGADCVAIAGALWCHADPEQFVSIIQRSVQHARLSRSQQGEAIKNVRIS